MNDAGIGRGADVYKKARGLRGPVVSLISLLFFRASILSAFVLAFTDEGCSRKGERKETCIPVNASILASCSAQRSYVLLSVRLIVPLGFIYFHAEAIKPLTF